jgi:hypothetical protein
MRPPEEDVAGRLHDAVAVHHALPNRAQSLVETSCAEPGEEALQSCRVIRERIRTIGYHLAPSVADPQAAIRDADPLFRYRPLTINRLVGNAI